MGDDVQLPPVCDTPVYIQDCRSAPSKLTMVVWYGQRLIVLWSLLRL